MNLSGKAVLYWLTKEKIPLENLLVITDDLNLPFGSIRLKIKGSDKEYKKWKNDNEGKTEMDFMEEIVSKSDKFSPGVYIIDKRAIVVDNEGNMAYEW